MTCRLCGNAAVHAGSKRSAYSGDYFALAHCPTCGYSFVVEPRTDFANLYSQKYYRGEGADPLVDYEREMRDPQTIRTYEWQGITRLVADTAKRDLRGLRWLDFGAGLGGLVRYARGRGAEAYGFDEGYAAGRMKELAIPSLDAGELTAAAGSFDIITAVEVLEHLIDPMAAINQIASLVAPGGHVIVTTGNPVPYTGRLSAWQYVLPEVHVGFFEPRTLAFAFALASLTASHRGFQPGHKDVIRYKVLKTLKIHRRGILERVVPWSLVTRVVDARYSITAQPVGQKDLGASA